jgi:hypothetical protein
MKMYAFRIYEQGSIVATDAEISKTAIIKRAKGQRYQNPSLLRAAKENNLNPEVLYGADPYFGYLKGVFGLWIIYGTWANDGYNDVCSR